MSGPLEEAAAARENHSDIEDSINQGKYQHYININMDGEKSSRRVS